MAKAPKKVETGDKKPALETENRKINPWIPIAVVAFIVALIALMAAMNSGSSNSGNSGTATTASGTTQSGSTGSTGTAQPVDVTWITLETTANQVSAQTGIPAKMLQQYLGIAEADMGKPFSEVGGAGVVTKAQDLVSQFGGGGMGGSTGSTGAPSGMGGTSGGTMGGTTTP